MKICYLIDNFHSDQMELYTTKFILITGINFYKEDKMKNHSASNNSNSFQPTYHIVK